MTFDLFHPIEWAPILRGVGVSIMVFIIFWGVCQWVIRGRDGVGD